MANNKVQLSDGTVLLDLTGDTVTPDTLLSGVTAHDAAGNPIVGTVVGIKLTGIAITSPPTKTAYNVGETFDPAGMVVTATFSNGEQLQPVNYQVVPAGPLTLETTQVEISYTWNGVTKTAYQAVSVVSVPIIYGAYWDWASNKGLTKGTRTDSAAAFADPEPAVNNGAGSSPFDNLMPWAGMVVEDDPTAGKLVKIPKFWYKWTQNGKSISLQIADAAVDGFHTSPAHADRGDGKGERDYVYIGRYHCASGYKSQAGSHPLTDMTRSQARTNIHNLGAAYWQSDIQMRITIWMLYLVEFADWNSQKTIGYGCSSSSSKFAMGATDAMKYHTGTNAGNRTTYGCTQYRYIEGLWDNVYDWMDGCYCNRNGLNIVTKPASFSDNANGVAVGVPSSGYPSAFAVSTKSGLEWVIYPTAASGSDSTYSADSWDFGSSSPCLCVGSYYGQGQIRGLFCVLYYRVSEADAGVGCRLQKLP